MKHRVLLAFSGGIDSITSVGLLRSQWDVETLTLDTIGDANMLRSARERARELGVPHTVLDVSAEFQQRIIDYFIDSYAAGRTPAPCTACNPLIKWRYLIEQADRRGIEHVATGHYFNVEEYNGHHYVARADDHRKDQSYYLWGLGEPTLRRALTPMGHMIKEEVKRNFSSSKESMGICFLQGETYRDYITRHRPHLAVEGDVVDCRGEVVGRHAGVAFYTIGQKRGFECRKAGMVVVGVDVERNRIVVGRDADLYHSMLEIARCNIIDKEEFMHADDVRAVVRGIGRNPQGFVRRVEPTERGYRILLDDAAWAPAVGQPVVFYRQNRVVGGGFLERYY